MARSKRTTTLISRLEVVAYNLQRLQFAHFQPLPTVWQPAVNVYLYEELLKVYVDLAGIDAGSVKVRASGHRIAISGTRESPERLVSESGTRCLRVLAMEIEQGPFSRILDLPVEVDPDETAIEYRQGLLYIQLRLRRTAVPLS